MTKQISLLEKDHIIRVIRSIASVDKSMAAIINASEEHRKKIRRRVEDHLRKCSVDELALIATLTGIKTEVNDKP